MLDDDRVVRRHTDHIRARKCDVDQAANQNNEIVEVVPVPVSEPEDEVLEIAVNTPTAGTSVPLCRSARTCRPPSRLIEETSN